MYHVFLVVSSLLAIGLIVTYKPALAECKVDAIDFCVLSEMVLEMPSWIGSFCGVFVSATLAYSYNLKKQRSDDNKKKWTEEVANANKAIMLLSKCYGDLGTIKTAFANHTQGIADIKRAMSCPHLVGRRYEPVDFDPTTIYFLLRQGNVEARSPRNPNYIFNTIERYNTVIALFNKRNEMALEISEKYQKVSVNDMNGYNVHLNLDFIKNEIGLSNFINHLTVTEMLFQQLDVVIKDIGLLSHELPQIFNHYFTKSELREKSFEHEIASFDPFHEPNDLINEPFSTLDIDTEVSKLISLMKLKKRYDWSCEGWYETPYSYQ